MNMRPVISQWFTRYHVALVHVLIMSMDKEIKFWLHEKVVKCRYQYILGRLNWLYLKEWRCSKIWNIRCNIGQTSKFATLPVTSVRLGSFYLSSWIPDTLYRYESSQHSKSIGLRYNPQFPTDKTGVWKWQYIPGLLSPHEWPQHIESKTLPWLLHWSACTVPTPLKRANMSITYSANKSQ